jgi:hypothetical protein
MNELPIEMFEVAANNTSIKCDGNICARIDRVYGLIMLHLYVNDSCTITQGN